MDDLTVAGLLEREGVEPVLMWAVKPTRPASTLFPYETIGWTARGVVIACDEAEAVVTVPRSPEDGEVTNARGREEVVNAGEKPMAKGEVVAHIGAAELRDLRTCAVNVEAVKGNLRAAGVDPDSGDLGELVLKTIRHWRERAERSEKVETELRAKAWAACDRAGAPLEGNERGKPWPAAERVAWLADEVAKRRTLLQLAHEARDNWRARAEKAEEFRLRVVTAVGATGSDDEAVLERVRALRTGGSGFDNVRKLTQDLADRLEPGPFNAVLEIAGVGLREVEHDSYLVGRRDGAKAALGAVLQFFTDEEIPF